MAVSGRTQHACVLPVSGVSVVHDTCVAAPLHSPCDVWMGAWPQQL